MVGALGRKMRSGGSGAERLTDAYAVLGVRPKASIQEVRVAWLRLVKELHPDAGFDGPAASDRLKAINLAYQTLKNPDQGQTEGRTDRRTFRSTGATFVVFLLVPIVGVALVMGTRIRSGPTRDATDEVATTRQEEPKVGSREFKLEPRLSRDTQEKRSLVSRAHETDRPGALAGGARDQPGQGTDSNSQAWQRATKRGDAGNRCNVGSRAAKEPQDPRILRIPMRTPATMPNKTRSGHWLRCGLRSGNKMRTTLRGPMRYAIIRNQPLSHI